jgi:hypothetical protein
MASRGHGNGILKALKWHAEGIMKALKRHPDGSEKACGWLRLFPLTINFANFVKTVVVKNTF